MNWGSWQLIDRSGKDSQTTYAPRRNDGLNYYYYYYLFPILLSLWHTNGSMESKYVHIYIFHIFMYPIYSPSYCLCDTFMDQWNASTYIHTFCIYLCIWFVSHPTVFVTHLRIHGICVHVHLHVCVCVRVDLVDDNNHWHSFFFYTSKITATSFQSWSNKKKLYKESWTKTITKITSNHRICMGMN